MSSYFRNSKCIVIKQIINAYNTLFASLMSSPEGGVINEVPQCMLGVVLKRHGPFVAFYLYCKTMLYGINYTYYSVKTVKICFYVPFMG